MRIPRGYSHPVKIGSGAYSTVWRVREKKLERPLALKVLSPRRGWNVCAGIDKEARVLASINTTRVPRIYDIQKKSASVILVMEWIEGVPLSVFTEAPLSPEIRLGIADDLIKALAQLHVHGIVHRDIKPENIILTPERGAVFVDFGFSGLVPVNHNNNVVESLKGTPRYMAPELWAKSDTIDYAKCDLYSLGVVLRDLYCDDALPIVNELLRDDPTLRPADCASFARVWQQSHGTVDEAPMRAAVAKAAAGYLSRLLFDGARGLYSAGRREEAYALCTESLDRWPDNPDAVAMLRDRFSQPLRAFQPRLVAAWTACAILLSLALTGAFVFGKRSQRAIFSKSADFIEERDERRLSIQEESPVKGPLSDQRIDLRTCSDAGGPYGSIVTMLPPGRGALSVDAKPVQASSAGRCTIEASEGTHRIEWYDSTTGRTFGETVDVLPFAKRRLSLARFVNEWR
jgi:hypothetical protein